MIKIYLINTLELTIIIGLNQTMICLLFVIFMHFTLNICNFY